jgi:hypothetical protein
MSDTRLIHKKIGQSQKLSALTDFEHRVWVQYLSSSDDYGVMPAWAYVLQADNVNLRRRPTDQVQTALEVSLSSGLLRSFEHQGERYVWSYNWQDEQKIDYPRQTVHPIPTCPELVHSTPKTLELFRKHPKFTRELLANLQKVFPPYARRRGRETLTLTRGGATSGDGGSGETVGARFAKFWQAYPKLRRVAKARAEKAFGKVDPDETVFARMLGALERQSRSDEWRRDSGRFIPHPSSWLNDRRWEDEASVPGEPSSDPLDPGVRALVTAAGLASHQIFPWFLGAELERDGVIVRLIIPDREQREWVTKHNSDQLIAAVIKAGDHDLIICDRTSAS